MKRRFFIYLATAILAGALAAGLMICAANDALALNRSGDAVSVEIQRDCGARELSTLLSDEKMIDLPLVFRVYASLRGKNEFKAGDYTLSRSMSYDEIFIALSGKKARTEIKITIPEGAYTDDIIGIFVSHGIGTREGFLAALDDDYGFDYIPEKTRGRTHRVDGYLFPDTYLFYSDSTEREVVAKMIRNFDAKFTEKMRAAAKKNGMTVDECVTLASVVQREAYYTAEMAALSSVLLNRLSSRALRRLECDATVTYALKTSGVTGEYLTVDSPYNTYINEGLPPGAICSPGLAALSAAAYPKKTDYYYFFSKSDNTFVFSKTYGEHLAGLRKYGVGKEKQQ